MLKISIRRKNKAIINFELTSDLHKFMYSLAHFTKNKEKSTDNFGPRNVSIPIIMDLNVNEFHWGDRAALQCKRRPHNFNIWNFIKKSIGEDLSKVTMPVNLNEPTSFLQRVAEYMEYSELLDLAAHESDDVRRMELVSAFAVSATSSNYDRIGKPFNPLLGETYELYRNGYRFVAEQVSHHPPISAFHAQSTTFQISGAIQPKIKLCGKDIKIVPSGLVTLHLYREQPAGARETYTWQNVNCLVHNIVIGDMWIEHAGALVVECASTSLKAELTFQPFSSLSSFLGKMGLITGLISHEPKLGPPQPLRCLLGSWVDCLLATPYEAYQKRRAALGLPAIGLANSRSTGKLSLRSLSLSIDPGRDSSPKPLRRVDFPDRGAFPELTELWLVKRRPLNSPDFYNFTALAMTLNQLPKSVNGQAAPTAFLPPTDSRFRPDMQALEQGLIDEAAAAKTRLEERQRVMQKEAKKSRKQGCCSASTLNLPPRWFHLGEAGRGHENCLSVEEQGEANCSAWTFDTVGYFTRDWGLCPVIYDTAH